jgi:hypothetical protein
LLVGLSAAAALYPKLSFPAVFFAVVGLVTMGPSKQTRVLVAVSCALSAVGLLRFVLEEAIPGVLAGGRAAIEKQAVSYCRTLVTAQDHARSKAYFDPDRDGVGSALALDELAGLAPLPTGNPLSEPPLALAQGEFRETALGPAVRQAGYLVAVCLPALDGTFSRAAAERDPERAEREFRIFAWPETLGAGSPTTAYFADANETILELPGSASPRYVGATRPPACDAVTQDGDWQRWKDKAPRDELPGDSSARAD